MKRIGVVFAFAVIALLMAFIFNKTGVMKTLTPEELEASIEVLDVKTKWVDKYYQPWPPKLTLVPTISFRIKNLTDKPLKYVNFNANFRFIDDYENLGDSFLAAIRNVPVEPGEISETIFLKSNYGVEGKSLASFEKNPRWKLVTVKLFAQSKGSQFITLGEWDVSREIDFKEPEPVGKRDPEEKKEDIK
jgi:hypothetical protein